MNYEKLQHLLKSNTSVKLLLADNAALIVSFLFQAFKRQQHLLQSGTDAMEEKDLAGLLSDYLYLINKDETLYPKPPKQYLTDWTNAGFLRKYPSPTNDEFLFELTPASENAFKWIDSLDKREFVGTESRLKNLFEKLKELSTKTKRDVVARMQELELQKQRIDAEIANLKLGKMDILDDRQIKEQYFLIEETARNLLSDFKQVEQNLRDLDRDFRKKIITTNTTKGKVLEELFRQQDFLLETDQGRSFAAFWEFLLSQSKQEELESLVAEMLNIPVVQTLQRDNFDMHHLRNYLIEAGDKTNKTTNSLLEQLRKYLEHKTFFENRRIHENINTLLRAISNNQDVFDSSRATFLEIDDIVGIDLMLERPLFEPPQKVKFVNSNPEQGYSENSQALLFDQFEISMAALRNNIKNALKNCSQISFTDFIKEYEITKGVAEVVAYLEIASKERTKHTIVEDTFDFIEVRNQKTQKKFKLKVPKIIFGR